MVIGATTTFSALPNFQQAYATYSVAISPQEVYSTNTDQFTFMPQAHPRNEASALARELVMEFGFPFWATSTGNLSDGMAGDFVERMIGGYMATHGRNLCLGTPYEKRYRAVRDAGGIRFYPQQPSRAFQKYLDEIGPLVGNVLIIGCGEGRNIEPLVSRGWKVTGIDSAPSGLTVAKNHYKNNPNVSLVVADALKPFPILDLSADLVVVIGLWHLITNPNDRQFILSEICRVLKAGGLAFFENNGNLDAKKIEYLEGGYVEQRTIQTQEGSKQIPLERLPTVMLNGETMKQELLAAGLVIDRMESGTFQHPDTIRNQIIVRARKVGRNRFLFANQTPIEIAGIPWQDNMRHALSDVAVRDFVQRALYNGYINIGVPATDVLVGEIFRYLDTNIHTHPVEEVLEYVRTSIASNWYGRSIRSRWSDYYRDVEAPFITNLIVPHVKGERLLEVGVGRGWISYHLINRVGNSARITQTDILDYREPIVREDNRFDFVPVTSDNPLPFEKDSFDTVIIVYVFHHLPPGQRRNSLLSCVNMIANKNVIILEDTYPLIGSSPTQFRYRQSNVIDQFMALSDAQKIYALTFSCTYSNRVDGGGKEVPTPGVFFDIDTLRKEFSKVFQQANVKSEFLGIPATKVYLNSEGLFIIEK